jgi:ribosomal protein S18 acetylase RimI-like enzyme
LTRFASEALGNHERSGFASGNERIDAYFHQAVTQDVRRNYAACYVLVEKATSKLAGLYTLSAHSMALTEVSPELARKLPRYPSIPAVLIGWLGRDIAFRGEQIGELLLADAIARVAAASIAAHALCADAIDEAAAAFYQAHQFTAFASRAHSYFLPMKTAIALLKGR